VKKIEKVHYCSRRGCGKPVAASSWPAMPFCCKSCQTAWNRDVTTFCKGLTRKQLKALGGVREWQKAMLQVAVTLDRPLDSLIPRPRWTSRKAPKPGMGGACFWEPTDKSGQHT
jgi:hypothetical protein